MPPSLPSPTSLIFEVFDTQGLGLRVRSSPSIQSNNIIGKVFDGTWLEDLGSSQQADGYTWQRVRLEGWVAADWLTPSPSNGATVQVQGTNEVGLRVRNNAQIVAGNILGKVYDGTTLQVLGGPQSNDGYQPMVLVGL